MATETEYPFSIASDFPTGTVATDRLARDVRSAAGISIALDRIDTAGDVCSVWFRDVLPTGEDTVLSALVAAHSGVPLPAEKKSADGVPSTRNLSYDPDRSPFRPGYRFTITPEAQNQWDILMDPATMVGADGTVQIMGGSLWVPADASRNDYVEIVVVDKTGVIPDIVDGQHSSLMEHYGIPTDGSAYLEVSDKIVRQGNVPVGNPAGRSFNPGGNFTAYGGLYLRVIYNATASVYTGPLGLDLNLAK